MTIHPEIFFQAQVMGRCYAILVSLESQKDKEFEVAEFAKGLLILWNCQLVIAESQPAA
jgi:hypothetical protein